MPKFVYKAPGGKLLKISLELEGEAISAIELRGDFFMYPEHGVVQIEQFLVGKNPSENFSEDLSLFLSENEIETFGFSPQDLFDAINQ